MHIAPPTGAGSIICVGLNYRKHAEESGMAIPTEPVLFGKWGNALAANGDDIVVPPEGQAQVDWEAELCVVIGKTATRVSIDDALDHVQGYTCANDVSARDLQLGGGAGQWIRGKSLDGFCPIGPSLVTPDELGDPQALGIRCLINGETMQDASTADMIFSVAEIISYISTLATLRPGDLILTGTPSGVGIGQKPPRFLADGDVMRVEIDGIGAIENRVVFRG